MWLYALIAIVTITIAFIVAKVVHVPEMAAKIDVDQNIDTATTQAKVHDAGELQEVVVEEIGDFVDSKYKREEIAKTVSTIFNREMDERLQQHAEELRKKYDEELAEKAKNEEIALKKYKKVLVEKKNTEAVIRSIADGLVVVDANGKVIMMNPAAEKLLDSDKKEKIGKSINDGLKDEQMVSLSKPAGTASVRPTRPR